MLARLTENKSKSVVITGHISKIKMDEIKTDMFVHDWFGNYIHNVFTTLTWQGYETFIFHQWGVFDQICNLSLHKLRNDNKSRHFTMGVLNFSKLNSYDKDPMSFMDEIIYWDKEQLTSNSDSIYKQILSNASLLVVSNMEKHWETGRLLSMACNSGIRIRDMELYSKNRRS